MQVVSKTQITIGTRMAYRHAKIDDREYNFKIWKPYDLGGSVIIRYCREGIRCE